MIRVYTSNGYGKWAQTTTTTISDLGPVLNLNANLDSRRNELVHLSWERPHEAGSVQVRTMPNCVETETKGRPTRWKVDCTGLKR